MDLPYLKIKGRSLLPVIQGGMGIGVSAHSLAGAVAAEGLLEPSQAWSYGVYTRI